MERKLTVLGDVEIAELCEEAYLKFYCFIYNLLLIIVLRLRGSSPAAFANTILRVRFEHKET